MKQTVAMYCQSLYGLGHFVRGSAIARALLPHYHVTMACGGRGQERIAWPAGLHRMELPPIWRGGLSRRLTCNGDWDAVTAQRLAMLTQWLETTRPDIFITDLFPLGRWDLGVEAPRCMEVARRVNPHVRLVMSVRDVYASVEAFDPQRIDYMNRHYDLVLCHGDARVITFAEQLQQPVHVPVVHTGYIVSEDAESTGYTADIVVSAGGGSDAFPLLSSAIRAWQRGAPGRTLRVFTGPNLPPAEFDALLQLAGSDIVTRFTGAFRYALSNASLSISRGGYNTTVDLLHAGVPAVVVPNLPNNDQGVRAARLHRLGFIHQATVDDLDELLASPPKPSARPFDIDLDGLGATVRALQSISDRRT